MNKFKHYMLEKYDIIMHPEDHWVIELVDFAREYVDIIVKTNTKQRVKTVIYFMIGNILILLAL